MLTLRTVHHMLASISLGILLVRREAFHLHDNILLISILSKDGQSSNSKTVENLANEKPICSFDQFKMILLSLFGEHLQFMSIEVIDETLRESYKQITISGDPVYEKSNKNNGKSGYNQDLNNDSLIMYKYGEVKELKLI